MPRSWTDVFLSSYGRRYCIKLIWRKNSNLGSNYPKNSNFRHFEIFPFLKKNDTQLSSNSIFSRNKAIWADSNLGWGIKFLIDWFRFQSRQRSRLASSAIFSFPFAKKFEFLPNFSAFKSIFQPDNKELR